MLCRTREAARTSTLWSKTCRHYEAINLLPDDFDNKNTWLFVGKADAGQRSAIIYTLTKYYRRQGELNLKVS